MPWPIPSARTIAERLAAAKETAIAAVRPDIDPVALSRAVRSARGMLSIIGRAVALELRETHDHLAWWSRQYFPDTAEAEFADRHGSIWGVERRAATFATGAVLIQGAVGTALPAGIELAAADGTRVTTAEPAAIGAGGTVAVDAAAAQAGEEGNLAAGERLAPVLPFPAIARVTVVSMAGGAAVESDASLAAAVLARIRQPPHGGAAFDYPVWLRAAFDVHAVRVVTDWIGRGSVGVIVAMRDGAGGRMPTADELEAMLEHLGPPGASTGLRPVTAHVVVVAAVPQPVPIAVRLRPDTTATRAAVAAAFERFVATIGDEEDTVNAGPIAAWIEPSRISEALSGAAGEYAHDLVAPAARYQLGATAYPTPGAITWAPPP